ncbi:hypothetical protein QLQ12_08215 [Actinoplanes sp. NEAU-A12]|uniref:Uncharacterized protein n=1 Tax=Actinoplanes sandaracinus TaxID=3045177 RepID=A0ABT6WFT9_9ACTN|nr:hypothetical protein [Actinoplanes sandaracinus]MDI6098584.1 hypothetical protein [Actinoplanes sandaracinus]
MSSRKLGHFVGLVFALAVVFGGVSEGMVTTDSSQAEVLNILNWDWA